MTLLPEHNFDTPLNEDYYKQVFKNLNQGFSLLKILRTEHNEYADYQYVTVNQVLEKITSRPQSDYIGKKISEVLPYLSLERLAEIAKNAENNIPTQINWYFKTINKHLNNWIFSPQPGYICILSFDTTTHAKNAEELAHKSLELSTTEEVATSTIDLLIAANIQLKTNNADLEQTKHEIEETRLWLLESQEAGQIGTYKLEPQSKTVHFSQTMGQLLGINPNGQYNLDDFYLLIHPDYRDSIYAFFTEQRLLSNAQFEKEYPIVRQCDNQVRWIAQRGKLFYTANGDVTHIIGTIQDITERKEADEKLQHSAEFNQSLIEAMPFPMHIVDHQNKILFQNSLMEKLAGKLIDQPCPFCKPNYYRAPCQKSVEFNTEFNNRNFQVTCNSIKFRGKEAVLQVFQDMTESLKTKQQLVDKNRQLLNAEESVKKANQQLVSLNRNLEEYITELELAKETTEKHETELLFTNAKLEELNKELIQSNQALINAKRKAEESDKLKSSFLQNMSHEIRTPLNAIVGFTELLVNTNGSKEQMQKYSQIIYQNSFQLIGIITDIMNISSIETGQVTKLSKPFYLNALFDDIWFQFSPIAKSKQLALHKQTPLADTKMVNDEVKLSQILINLVSNALKFTHHGSISFGYTVKSQVVEIFVQDTGIGISPELSSIIFEKFRQGMESFSREYGGNGLGLSIAQAYVHLLGGEIWFESEPEKGSVFKFTIPLNP